MIKFVFWDVQHGHATYLQTPNKHIVFDLGVGSYGSNQDFSPLLCLKNKWKVERLDEVVITHPHRDHVDDIFNLAALSPRILLRPKHLSEEDIRKGNRSDDKSIIDKYLQLNRDYNAPVPAAEDPFVASNNGGVDIQTFIPSSCGTSNLNNHSVVTVISYASSKMIIPGDNEPASWEELLGKAAFVNAIEGTDILLAPHHGRDSGFSDALFEHISPKLVIVSDGRFCDTSATDRYSEKTEGWKVHKRDGSTEERKCVTTRSDGVILVEFGTASDYRPYMKVTID